MARLVIYWNFVDCVKTTNISSYAKPSAIVNRPNVAAQSRGIYYRSVVSEDLDASDLLDQINLEAVRRARNEPDNTLLFRPKPGTEKSIGVLRIIKPRRFVSTKPLNTGPSNVNIDKVSKQYDILLESTEFILEEAQEQMTERFQLQETFGDFSVNFFGKRAEIFTYSGALLNGRDNLQWRNQFLDNYEKFLRGTKCAELQARAYLLYDDVMREGYILSAGTSQSATVEGVVRFNFTMLITAKRTLGVIPPSRSGTLVTAFKPSTKVGLSDFQFFRSVGDALPGVYTPVPVDTGSGDFVSQIPENASFSVNTSLPGDQPPDDSKQQMINLTMAAIQKAQSQDGNVTVNDQSVDHDVLLDFIPASQLGSTSKLIASGVKSLDVDNFDGEQLVALLTDGQLSVEDLKFIQAVKAADSIGKSNSDQTLTDLSQFFSTNGDPRVNMRVTAPEPDVIVAPKEYVLDISLDNAQLNSVITTTKSFADFDEASLLKKIVDGMTCSIVQALVSDAGNLSSFKAATAFVAAMCVIKDPSTSSIFTQVTDSLSDAGSLGGKPNAYDYVLSQVVSKVKPVLDGLPDAVSQKFSDCLVNDLQPSGIMQTIAAKFGVALDEIFVNEAILGVASGGSSSPPLSAQSAKFIDQVGILITAVIAEMVGVTPTSTDSVGGAIKPSRAVTDYFTPSNADSLAPNQNLENTRMAVQLPSYQLYQGSDYIALPTGVVGHTVDFAAKSDAHAISQPTDPDDQALQSVGIIKVDSTAQTLLNEPGTVVAFDVQKRRTPVTVTGSTKNASVGAGGGDPIFDSILGKSNQPTTIFTVTKLPIDQNHLGSGALTNTEPTSASLKSALSSIIQKFSGFQAAVDEASSNLTTVLSGGDNQDLVDMAKPQLTIDKFMSIPEVAQLKSDLDTVGVTVTNVIDLFLYAQQQKDMAQKTATLKSSLSTAVAGMQNDPDNKAAAVAKSNQSFADAVSG